MNRTLTLATRLWISFGALVVLTCTATAEPVVFAAASTARAMEAVMAAYPGEATASYASSGTLARQIEQGAPADLFLSANPQWMDWLAERGLVDADAVTPLLSNRLVIIGPEGAAKIAHGPGALQAALGAEHFTMADPDHAPVGRYGRSALESMGCWGVVEDRIAATKDTRAAVALVARGEAGLGLVYASDALGVDGIDVLTEVPGQVTPEIVYPVAPVLGGADPEGTAALLAFLTGPEAAAIFAAHGFTLGTPAPAPATTHSHGTGH
ncbi:MAG: molybdate ABC transporter substrate-binding protein [Pseudomonadota bacterium]